MPFAAAACILVSCHNMGGGSLSDGSTQGDSLLYFTAQGEGVNYMRQAERDTAMKEASAKQAYIAGVKAGLTAMKEGDENYNKGVMAGVNMAMQIEGYCKAMDVTMDKSLFVGGLESVMNSDSLPDMQKLQLEMRRLQSEIEMAKKEKDEAASRLSLSGEAKKNDLPKISDDLYGKVTESNDSVALKDGDEVSLDVKIEQIDGKDVRYKVPVKGVVGKPTIPEVISDALLQMKSGETGEFLTSAHALIPGGSKRYDLEPTEVLKLTIKASVIPAEETADKK